MRKLGRAAHVVRGLERCTCYRFRTGAFGHEVVDRLVQHASGGDDPPLTTLLISVTAAQRTYGLRDATRTLPTYRVEGFSGSYVTMGDVECHPSVREFKRRRVQRADTSVADVRFGAWWTHAANAYVRSGRPGLRVAIPAEVAAVEKCRVSIDALRAYATSLDLNAEELTFEPSNRGREVIMRCGATGSGWCSDLARGPAARAVRTHAYVRDRQRMAMLRVFHLAQLPDDVCRLVVSYLGTSRRRRPPSWMRSS